MKKKILLIILLINGFIIHAEEALLVLQGDEIHNTNTILSVGSTVYAETSLRIRDCPELKSSVIGLLASGEKVQIIEIGKQEVIDNIQSNWIKVKNSRISGWCFGGYVSSPIIIHPRIFEGSFSLSAEKTEDGKSFYLSDNYSKFIFENCYFASSTNYSDEWYPYVCFVNNSNKILYVLNLKEGIIIPTVKVDDFNVRYATVTPNNKYLIYTYSNKDEYETESTHYIKIYEIKTQRLVSEIEKYCKEMNYVMYHFKENPDILRINVDEECAGEGILHSFYFNQKTEQISFGKNWNDRWPYVHYSN